MATTNVNGVIVNKITKTQYDAERLANNITDAMAQNEVWIFTDDQHVSASEKESWNGKSNFSGNYDDLTNKPTIPTVPTALSSFTNDAGFITKTVNNLDNYYKKSETYTKTEVNNLVNGISTMNVSVVNSLPTTGSATTIYLVAKTSSATQNIYDEYLYVNNKWEKIGDTQIDLSGYALSSDIPTKTSELTNDSNFVTDSSYVHTDNNFTNTYKSNIDSNTSSRHSHSNKTVLDNTTASYTTALNTKLNGIEAGAKVNVIESVKVNGTALTPSNKSVNITVPTAVTKIWE